MAVPSTILFSFIYLKSVYTYTPACVYENRRKLFFFAKNRAGNVIRFQFCRK